MPCSDRRTDLSPCPGAARQAIEQALAAAGKYPGHLRPADLALLEDFHTMGRIATTQLADLVEITPDDEVLDAGSGIGGTARYVAGRSRCHVVAVDLTGEYCQTARWLNQLAGLDDRIAVERPHRPRGRDDAGTAHAASQPDRTAGLCPQLRVESQEPHHRAGRRPAARRPGRRTSGLRRAAIRPARTRTMRSKIVIIVRRLCVDEAGKARHAPSACRESARATSRPRPCRLPS